VRYLLDLRYAVFLISLSLCGQQSSSWHDPSPHRVQFVVVQEGVRLEVLDWGGTGRPVVLLAGYRTAHMFDDFAVKLSKIAHVYGITRRGYGASSHPDTGYDAQRSADDVLQVINILHLTQPVMAGHSFGGQDMTFIAEQYSKRLAGLVYLNSAEDPTLTLSDYGVKPFDSKKLPIGMQNPPPPPHLTPAEYRAWQRRMHGIAFPEAELRNTYVINQDDTLGSPSTSQHIHDAMFKGILKPNFGRIQVPVLAFFALPSTPEEQIKQYKAQTPEERAAVGQKYVVDLAIVRRHMEDLKRGVPNVHIVELPGANFYIFASNEVDILRSMRAFLTALH
jgi:non-heme chloroperoxidase